MEEILEDENIILYRGFFSGVDFEVLVEKESREAKVVISSSILENPNYKTFFLTAYKGAIKNKRLENMKKIYLQFVPLNDKEEERSKELIHNFSFGGDAKIIRKKKKQILLENYFKRNLLMEKKNGSAQIYLLDGSSFISLSYLELERGISVLFQNQEFDFEKSSLEELANLVVNQFGQIKDKKVGQMKKLVKKNNEGMIEVQTFLFLIFVMGVLMGSLYYFSR